MRPATFRLGRLPGTGGALLLPLLLALGPGAGEAQVVAGRLLDAVGGGPIVMGYLALLTEEGAPVVWTLSDEEGSFDLEAPESGSYFLFGESMGYFAGADGPLTLEAGGTLHVEMALAPMPLVLDSLKVTARSRSPALVQAGFYQRERAGPGYFIGPERIQRRSSASWISDFFWGVPGVRLVQVWRRWSVGSDRYVPYMRCGAGCCAPEVWMDGWRLPSLADLDSWVHPMDVEGIEVYRQGQAPARFATARASSCGLILIWTRRAVFPSGTGGP